MFVELNSIKGAVIDLDGFVYEKDGLWTVRRNLRDYAKVFSKHKTACFSSKIPMMKARALIKQELGRNLAVFLPVHGTLENEKFRRVPILRAKESLRLRSSEVLFISASPENLKEATAARLGTVSVEMEDYSNEEENLLFEHLPDFLVSGPNQLSEIIAGKRLGYCSEVACVPIQFFRELYEDNSISTGTRCWFMRDRIPADGYPEVTVHILGRYLPVEDSRHFKHSLSVRIINAKSHPRNQQTVFGHCLALFLNALFKQQVNFDWITSVPARPSDVDRLEFFLQHLRQDSVCPVDSRAIRGDLLKCIRKYPTQKNAGSFANRHKNVRNCFKVCSPAEVKNKSVLVVDDVITSGSTLLETARVLFDAGAKSVSCVALAMTNLAAASPVNLHVLRCPACNVSLEQRFNSTSGEPFWGCSDYFTKKCRGSLGFVDAVRQLNQLDEPILSEVEALAADARF